MLHSFLTANRSELIERCKAAAAARRQTDRDENATTHGIPIFLGQLIETLAIEQTAESDRSRAVSGLAGGGAPSEIGDLAALHGRDLLRSGLPLEEIVREYGDLCQAVTTLAHEMRAPIAVEEFRTLNRCLDNAIAGAVAEARVEHSNRAADEGLDALNTRLAPLAHELRNHLHVAMHAVRAIQAGTVGISGATGAVLERSLSSMRSLIDSSLADVRVIAGLTPRAKAIRLTDFLAEVQAAAILDPRARTFGFTVTPVDPSIVVYADPEMLASAVGNLLQNAFMFTQPNTEVTLHTHRAGRRILIEVKDHCGGLPPGPAEGLLLPFAQRGNDRSGLGLGLDICRRSIEANHGILRVRDLPGVGCVFTIDLPEPENALR